MTVGAREIGVIGAALSGLAALGLLGAVPGAAAIAGAAVVIAAPRARAAVARLPWPLVTLPVLAGIAAWIALGGGPEEALALMLAYLQVHRRLARRSASDDRVSVLLSGLMLVAAASRTTSPGFLVVCLAWLGALPLALLPDVRLPLRRWHLAPPALVVGGALALFPVLPRLGGPGGAIGRTGLSDHVELGALDALFDDPTEVVRVAAEPPIPPPLYLRGAAFDRFDGRRWWASGGESEPVSDGEGATRLRIEAVATLGGALFTAGQVASVEAAPPVRRDAQGAWRLLAPREGALTYTVWADPPFGGQGPVAGAEPDATPWLALPEGLDPRIAALAGSIAPEQRDPVALAEAMSAWLRDGHAYTRQPMEHGEAAALATFLFERRTGHCEHFASALAVLLRARGVPARLVTGLAGGAVDPVTGELVFRRSDAHAWVELLTTDGWVRTDPTPGPPTPPVVQPPSLLQRALELWRTRVVEWDGAAQRDALVAGGRRIEQLLRVGTAYRPGVPWRGLVVLGVVALAAGIGGRAGLRQVASRLSGEGRPGPRGPVARQHLRARRHVEARGWRIPGHLPPVAAARWLRSRAPGAESAALEELAWLLYAVRYGGRPESEVVARARELAAAVMQLEPPRANG